MSREEKLARLSNIEDELLALAALGRKEAQRWKQLWRESSDLEEELYWEGIAQDSDQTQNNKEGI